MGKIEVLVSCMNQNDIRKLVDQLNIKTDAIIINQCNRNAFEEVMINGRKIRIYHSDQIGLSRSRNYALNNARGDICILCDDDVTFVDNYEDIIKEAFKCLPHADIIVFNTTLKGVKKTRRKPITKIRKAPKYRNYGSVRIAFRLKSFHKHNIWFNVNFGAGSIYGLGEDSLLLREANKKGLKIYEYPAYIATVDYSNSSWFTGYNEKYFYNIGAWLATSFPILKFIFMFYYVFKLKESTHLSFIQILKWLTIGMKGYKENKPYEDYINQNSYQNI